MVTRHTEKNRQRDTQTYREPNKRGGTRIKTNKKENDNMQKKM